MKQSNASKFPNRNSEAYKLHVIRMGFRTTKNFSNKRYVNFIVSYLIIIIIIIIIISFYLIVSSKFLSLDFHFSTTVILKGTRIVMLQSNILC